MSANDVVANPTLVRFSEHYSYLYPRGAVVVVVFFLVLLIWSLISKELERY